MTTSGWATIAFGTYSPLAPPSERPTTSLRCTKQVEEDDGDGDEHSTGQKHAPGIDVVLSNPGGEAERQRLVALGGSEDEREQELVPGMVEAEDAHRDDAWKSQGHGDAVHGLQARASVDHRAFFKADRDSVEVGAHEPERERQREGGVGDDQREQRVSQAELDHIDVQRKDEENLRQHVADQRGIRERRDAEELESAEAVGAQAADHEREKGSATGHDKAVGEIDGKVRLHEQVPVVLQGPFLRQEGGRGGVELSAGLEGAQHHPEQRETDHGDRREDQEVEHDARGKMVHVRHLVVAAGALRGGGDRQGCGRHWRASARLIRMK